MGILFYKLLSAVQVKLFTEIFGNLFNSTIFAILRADTRESLAEASKLFDKNLKVGPSCCQ